MPNAKDISVDFRLFAMFVGKYDSGKTTSLCSFPGKKYVLDFDGRIVAVRGDPTVDFDFFTSSKEGFKEADETIEKLVIKAKLNQNPYTMVGFDSLSTARHFLLEDSKRLIGEIDKNKGRKIGSLQLANLENYGYESEALRQLIWDGLKQLKCNVVVTAHLVDEFKSFQKAPGAPAERVLVGEKIYGDPALLAVLPVAFTEIYHFEKEIDPSTKRSRRFVTFDDDVARTTYSQLRNVGRVEITGKSFYEVWKELISK